MIAKEIIIIMFIEFTIIVDEVNKSIDEKKINIIEAIAWIKKYLIDISVDSLVNLNKIIGIILIKLISKPNQQINHELEEIAIIVPRKRKIIKMIW